MESLFNKNGLQSINPKSVSENDMDDKKSIISPLNRSRLLILKDELTTKRIDKNNASKLIDKKDELSNIRSVGDQKKLMVTKIMPIDEKDSKVSLSKSKNIAVPILSSSRAVNNKNMSASTRSEISPESSDNIKDRPKAIESKKYFSIFKGTSNLKDNSKDINEVFVNPKANLYGHESATNNTDPIIIEDLVDELEDKARNYFILFTKERKAREKLERQSYWLQEENKTLQDTIRNQIQCIGSLQEKLVDLRGDPNSLTETIERIDMLYTQLDTLIQAFAGVCSYVTFHEPMDRSEILELILEYLHPCRGLDIRLNSLYGSIYYFKLGIVKELPPPVEPPPKIPGYDTWEPPKIEISKDNKDTDNLLASSNQANVPKKLDNATIESNPTPKSPLSPIPNLGLINKKLNSNNIELTVYNRGSVDAIIPKDSLHLKGDPEVKLKGFQIKINSIQNIDNSYENSRLYIVIRNDNESSIQAKDYKGRKSEYLNVKDKGDGTFTIDSKISLDIDQLPPKSPGVLPKYVIDLWDESDNSKPIGTATKTFIDPVTLVENHAWEILNTKNKVVGVAYVSIIPKPVNSMLPAGRYIIAKVAKSKSKTKSDLEADNSVNENLDNGVNNTKNLVKPVTPIKSKLSKEINLLKEKSSVKDDTLQTVKLHHIVKNDLNKTRTNLPSQDEIKPIHEIPANNIPNKAVLNETSNELSPKVKDIKSPPTPPKKVSSLLIKNKSIEVNNSSLPLEDVKEPPIESIKKSESITLKESINKKDSVVKIEKSIPKDLTSISKELPKSKSSLAVSETNTSESHTSVNSESVSTKYTEPIKSEPSMKSKALTESKSIKQLKSLSTKKSIDMNKSESLKGSVLGSQKILPKESIKEVQTAIKQEPQQPKFLPVSPPPLIKKALIDGKTPLLIKPKVPAHLIVKKKQELITIKPKGSVLLPHPNDTNQPSKIHYEKTIPIKVPTNIKPKILPKIKITPKPLPK
ncbi:uncharacterized protein CMU_020720 [Cryptosporidium muris RN66]|uniref:Uncharacterized protein n=1 Tax=Cryptosporidium muris (strain RN66) TaxID=441375 RepID=B6AJ91_CRYMR|nr:uncharacterized protein CMU_020720 [Cryptosporidium muris RN66]EEA08328.1 hypothetical protein, conserved [Cryptosporidium muris RN66]|eukprot:XP_002142677.1 hypothetical protein [Cryptosporidium muris RN66]